MIVVLQLNNGTYVKGQLVEKSNKGVMLKHNLSRLNHPICMFYETENIKEAKEIPSLRQGFAKNILERMKNDDSHKR